jgi:hypothetical protein
MNQDYPIHAAIEVNTDAEDHTGQGQLALICMAFGTDLGDYSWWIESCPPLRWSSPGF